MDATVKSDGKELVIRLANGCTVSQRRNGPAEAWAPGGEKIAMAPANHRDNVAWCVSRALLWQPPTQT